MQFDITVESERFYKALCKCLHKPEDSLERWEVRIKNQKEQDGKFKDYIVYLAEFIYGPFDEYRVKARKKYFRTLEDEELVKMIFKALSKHHPCFYFDFKKAKFVKRMVAY